MVPISPEPLAAAPAPVFVIHADGDEWFVHGQLVPALGLTAEEVRLSSQLSIGELTLQALDRNIAECRVTLVVVSHATAAAPWAQFAAALASHAAVEGAARVVPLVLDEGAGDRWLRVRVAVDLSKRERWEGELTALARRLGAVGERREEALACPYPGMRALRAQDGALLVGRRDDVTEITQRLYAEQRDLVLVGSSGTGKSSLVHAGVVPELQEGRWRELVVRDLRPGQHPVTRLREALSCEGEADARPDPGEWQHRAACLLRGRGGEARLLLVIDQLEEVFALASAEEQRSFWAALSELRSQSRCYLIYCLRADFFGQLIRSALWRGGELAHRVIAPLRGAPLRKAIADPAHRAGVYLEPALVERLLSEADGSEHSLPLLQAALVQLWDQRERRLLSLAAYQRLCGDHKSGLGAAMSRHADACLNELSAAQRKIARRVLLRLVCFGESAQDSRWSRPHAELRAGEESEEELEAVLEHLTRARLVVRDADGSEGEQRVDLAHEALLSSWETLAGWIHARRADGQRRRQHEHSAAVWAARGRGTAGLLDGRELSESGQWRRSEVARELGESVELTAFFDASEREQRSRRRRARHRLVAVALTIAVLCLLVVWAMSAESLRVAAVNDREIAVEERLKSELQRLRELARAELADGKPLAAQPYLEQARALVGNADPDAALSLMFREAKRFTLVASQAHASDLSALALSPGGERFATVTVDGALQMWRTSDGERIGQPLHHARGAVTGVAFFPDGQRLVSGGEDGTARMWDSLGRPIGPALHHGAPLRVVEVSPDGHTILTGGSDGRAIIWSAHTGERMSRPLVHRAPIGAASFSRDSSLVAIASDDHGARVWRVRDGIPITRPLLHEDNLVSLDISPDNARLLTANSDKGAKVWQLSSSAKAFDIAVAKGLSWAEYSPDGAQILTAADAKWVGRWSALNGDPVGDSISHSAGVNDARYSGDGKRIATASNDKTARVWDATTGRHLTAPLPHGGAVLRVVLNREGTLVVTAAADRITRIWKIEVPSAELVTFPHRGEVNDIAFSRDGKWLATASEDKDVKLWSAEHGELLRRLPQAGGVDHVAISPDLEIIAVAVGKQVHLWRPNGEPYAKSIQHAASVRDLTFDRNGAFLVTATKGGELRGTNVRDGTQLFRWSSSDAIECIALSPDGAKLAVGTERGDIRLWDIDAGRQRPVSFKHVERVKSLQFSEDGARLLSASTDRRVHVWSLKEKQALMSLAHDQAVASARLSPDGRWIATASRRFVILWDAETGKEVVRRTFSDWMSSVAWSPDSKWLAMGGRQDLVERWNVEEEPRSRLALQCFNEKRREQDLSAARTLATPPALTSCSAAPPLPSDE